MNKWEYTVIVQDSRHPGAIENELNSLGIQGWEVVATMIQTGSVFHDVILKRPVK